MKNHQRIISQWLEQIGQERGVTLALDKSGHCIIPYTIESSCVVEVPADLDVPAVFIYLPLIQLSENPTAQLQLTSRALEMNIFGLLTGGCHIALDKRSNYIVLSYSAMVSAISDEDFKRIINELPELAIKLQQHLQKVAEQPSTTSELLSAQFLPNRLRTPPGKK